MSVKKADLYEHNNPDLAFVDGNSVRGGRRVVADRETLYGLVAKADQLKQNVTIVRILSDGENGGGPTEVLLVAAANIGSSAGWELHNSGNSSTPGTGSPAIYADFSFEVSTDGAQSFALPAGTLGLDGPVQIYQGNNGLVRTTAQWQFSNGNLVLDAKASLLAGDTVVGRRFYGGSPQAGGAQVNASDIVGVLSANQLPPLADADIAQLYELLKPYLDQRYVQI